MAQNEKDVILEIKVQYQDAIKGIAKYTQMIEETKQAQESFKKQLKEGSMSQEKYAESMAAAKAQMDYNKRAIQVLNPNFSTKYVIGYKNQDN
jgi:guanylate kinase